MGVAGLGKTKTKNIEAGNGCNLLFWVEIKGLFSSGASS